MKNEQIQNKNCKITYGNERLPYIFLLHGYDTTETTMFNWYNLIFSKYDFTLIGCRRKKINDWVFDFNESLDFINTIKRECIIIGQSLGGAEGLFLTQSPYVKKAFIIASPFNLDFKINRSLYQTIAFGLMEFFNNKRKFNSETLEQVGSVLPYSLKFSKEQKEKIYLIYSKNDLLIPIHQFDLMQKHLNLKSNHFLLLKYDSHTLIPFNSNTTNYILNNLTEYIKKETPLQKETQQVNQIIEEWKKK